jgi:hypothetical protein
VLKVTPSSWARFSWVIPRARRIDRRRSGITRCCEPDSIANTISHQASNRGHGLPELRIYWCGGWPVSGPMRAMSVLIDRVYRLDVAAP